MENNVIKEDQQRWTDFQTGDKDALAYFFKTFIGSLYNYGLKFTQDEDVIEDTIQDLFICLWTTRKRLSMPVSARNYLLKAFRNLLFRKLSRLRKMSKYESEYIFFDVELSAEANHIDTEQQLIRDRRLEHALHRLPHRQKEAIYLRFFENASYERIAEVMDTTVRASYKNVFRGLCYLRETLVIMIAYYLFCRMLS
ncbi:sigma-70 family RNA polymerase sigma factor [Chitinophaga sp. G-6-1-13]|uniref:Sigma-70 family RNA polymerase sigma factor n=1 Tax=Chitinophaga fulva TaxID=2728842 RepID=A0A848GT31_9BACT|nr:sigma-70 family RNA polymerase sigma factor [Chitinophaga fulva]NML40282.1 sigma-70 family RNA polymerase sigma factor [Chitinophaga fulva]